MRVIRTISMNPVEPEQISFRLASGLPLVLDLQYLDFAGEALTEDLVAQLQITNRTNSRTTSYPVPATDIVNGKAQVTIGGGELTDMNGYRLRLVGTYNGEPTLFALGTLRITEAAGFEATPSDIIDTIPITLAYGMAAALYINLWADSTKGEPFDLSTAVITAEIFASRGETVSLDTFIVVPTGQPGQVVLNLTIAEVNILPPSCWWALRASSAAGTITLAEGTVTVK